MKERARVLEVRGNTFILQCADNPGCESCSSAFCNVKAHTFEAVCLPELTPMVGDQVDVFVEPSRAIGSGFLVLIFPLILFVVAYLAFGFLDNEALQVAAGLGGLVLGFGLVYLLGRRRRGELPRIVHVYSDSTLTPVRVHGTTV